MAGDAGYPIFLDLAGRPVLVVGAGKVALRKARGLVAAGAKVTVVGPHIADEFRTLPGVETLAESYQGSLMWREKWRLAFAATDVQDVNEAVQRDAAAAGILCCRCDNQETGDFSGAATGRVGAVTLAISTQGASPAIARRIRDQAIAAIDPVLAALAELLEQWRTQVKERVAEPSARRELLLKLSGPEMETCLRTNGKEGAAALFERWLAETLNSGT